MNLWTQADGVLTLDLHPGQTRAWESTRRFVVVLAGTQSGKTSFEPWWLWREIQRCGAGDYLAVTATFDLFKLKFLPTLRECFEHVLRVGRYWTGDRIIELADPATGRFQARRADDPMWGRIILRSADSEAGLESATARAAVLDEAGLYPQTAWEAVRRRLALSRGRGFIGTTLYTLNWLKTLVYDRWAAGDPDIDVIHFDSTANPAFSREEFELARRTWPRFRFNRQYRGLPDQPAGLIYDCFSRARHTCRRFPVPPSWPRYWGVDFGGVHTAVLCLAEDPATRRLYVTREYLAGGRTAREHAAVLLAAGTPAAEPPPRRVAGGAKSEGQWRAEFAAAGLPMEAPDVHAVEVGIQRVYGAFAADELLIFDDLEGTLDQLDSYSRETDALGQPTEAIAAKETYHFLDALRYIVSRLRPGGLPEDADAPMPEVYA